MKHLTYHDHVDLSDMALDALVCLVPMMSVRDSKEYFELFEKVLNDGLIQSMMINRSGKIELCKVTLHVSSTYILIGSHTYAIYEYSSRNLVSLALRR